nr:mitochondrial carrier triple repeat protein [Hymenolepis microstoma]
MRSDLGNPKLIENGKTAFHVPKEYVCGAAASMANLIIVFPLHKAVFFQQLDGVRFSVAFARLRLEGLTHLFRGVLPPLLQRSTSASVMFGFQSQSQRFLNRNQTTMKLPPYLKTIISATMAGSLEAALTPFERVQTLLQSSNNSLLYKNTSRALYSLLKSHGIRELYRGYTPIFLRNCIGNILYFIGKDRLMEVSNYQDLPSGQRHLTDFLIGGFLGSTIGAINFPLNVVKCQMQSVVGTKFTSLGSSVQTLLSERQHVKIRRLYSGLPANVARSLLSWGIITMVYEWLLTL